MPGKGFGDGKYYIRPRSCNQNQWGSVQAQGAAQMESVTSLGTKLFCLFFYRWHMIKFKIKPLGH